MALSYFLLIEGAPGIGKTVLSKEIAYQWAENKVLKCTRLVFLLFLRDPNIKYLSSLEDLIQYLFKGSEIVSGLSKYLLRNKGKGLTVIFDGYDEMSQEDRNNSILTRIISRTVLPQCDLVVTSRPSASLYLRDMADCRVEVLGFTEEDRLDYIQHALEGSDDKIKALQFYLQANATINALCYVPLNMTILLCLFEEMKYLPHNAWDLESIEKIGLPHTQTEMYERFTLMTITRFMKKKDKSYTDKCLKISELPEPYNEAFNELLHLAYNALRKDEIVFNLNDEVVQSCPIIKSGNREGLGLLKVTEHVSNFSFHFLHFSIQEYLAAYYIASQSTSFQLELLRTTFWDIHYFNTWIMYVGITGGKKVAWKHFISGNSFMVFAKVLKSSRISKRILSDKIKSLNLFQCFAEIGNKKLVGKVFQDQIIDLSNQTLLPKDINAICFFLLRSVNQQWIKLDLCNCNIGDTGSDTLCKTFLGKCSNIVSIDKVDLSYNQIQIHSMSGLLDVLKVWHTSEAVISGNCDYDSSLFELCLNKFSLYVDKDFSQAVLIGPFLFAHNVDDQCVSRQLKYSTNITGLFLSHCSVSFKNLVYQELRHKINLSKLHIIGDNMSKDFIKYVVRQIKEVDSVFIYDHTLSEEDVKYISLMLLYKVNSSSLGVWVVIGGTKILGNIPDMLALTKHLSPVEICNLGDGIKRLCNSSTMYTEKFSTERFSMHSLHESRCVSQNFFHTLYKNISKCEIKFSLIENNLLIANRMKCGKIKELLTSNTDLISISIRKSEMNATELKKFVDLISKQGSLERLYIFVSTLEMHAFNYTQLLSQTLRLKELFIHNTNSTSSTPFNLLAMQRDFPNISFVLITNNILIGLNPTNDQILLSSKLDVNMTICKLCNFVSNIDLFQQMANTLSNVGELHILGCNFGQYSLQETEVFQSIITSSITKLCISHNEMNKQAVDDMAKLVSHIPQLEELDLSYNNLQATATVKVLNEINTLSLTRLNISNNGLNDKTACGIANFLSHYRLLKELDLSCNNLQAMGVITICKGMSNLLNLVALNISNNNISGEAAADIAAILFQSNLLEELDLSYNNLGGLGSLHMFHSMKNITRLTKLNVCSIGITKAAASDIALVLNNNDKLQDLDLSHNSIGSEGATVVFKKTSSMNLQSFNISHNDITNDVDGIKAFLSRNKNLEKLDLSHNKIQAAGAIKVCKTNLLKLTSFNLSHNYITTEAAADIGNFLFHNSKLQILDLSGNELTASGYKNIFKNLHMYDLSSLKVSCGTVINEAADELVTVLLHNTLLQELDLSYNFLSMSDCAKIFKGMENITNLEIINVSHNMVIDEAVDALTHILLRNFRLKELNLSYDNLSASSIIKIFQAMKNISNLETINVSHNMITDECVESIAAVLSHNKKLKSLDLSSNYLQYDGFIKIFNVLVNIKYLRKLNISCNQITATAVHNIAMFSHKSKLEELDSSNNVMQSAGTITLFKSLRCILSLKKLYINGNMITDKAADAIAVVLSENTNLEVLDISCNHLQATGAIKIFKAMKNISNLETINISHNMITDEAAENIATVLSHNINLKTIDLSSNYFKPEGFVEIFDGIKNIVHLEKLFIGCNEITGFKALDCIANFLFHNVELQELDLRNSFLQAEGIIKIFKSMKSITNLRKLYICDNIISDEAAGDIAAILSQNPKLEELDVSCTNLQTTGAVKIFEGMRETSTLTQINIAHNMITDKATEHVMNILSNNNKLKEINLNYNNVVISDLTKCSFTNLQELNVSCTSLETAVSIEGLNVSTLKKCKISNNCITANSINGIAALLSQNDDLQELDLSYNSLQEVGTKGILDFINISNLTKLNISYNDITSTSSLTDILTHATKLLQLDLSYNKLSSDNIKYFVYKLKNVLVNLVNLNLSGNEICNGAATALTKVLSENNKLQELSLNHTNLRREDINKIFSELCIPCLTKLSISHNNITDEAAGDIATFLSKCKELGELDISHNHLKSVGIIKICETNLTKLTTFNVNSNDITAEAAKCMAAFLSRNLELKVLDLSNNNLQELGCRNIFRVLKSLSLLSVLTMCNGSIINKAADELLSVLLHNTLIQELDLSYNNLSTSDAVQIFKAMKNVSNLEAINISHNMITDEAAENIATVLSHNNKLKLLDLSSNYFTYEGFIKIFKFLRNVTYLKQLNISCNEITAKAASSIATVVSHNYKLEVLDLGNTLMQAAGITTIFNSLRHTISLKKIHINDNMITNEAADDIAVVLSRNIKLEELDISCNNLLTAGIIEIFQGIKHILTFTKLNFAYNVINYQALPYITAVLCKNIRLKELTLSCNNLKGVNIFHNVKIPHLTKIKLSNSNITKKAAAEISGFLSHCINLQVLDMSYNNLSTSDAIEIFTGIKNAVDLEDVNFSHNLIADKAAETIGIVLSHSSKLNSLDLSCNNFRSDSFVKLFEHLKNVMHLRKLNISDNEVTAMAAQGIASVLSLTSILEELDVGNNFIQTRSSNMVIKSLRHVSTLKKLYINGNKITDEAADDIATVLSHNTKLEVLDISCNSLQTAGAITIFQNIQHISTLTKLNIAYNAVSYQAMPYIAGFISKSDMLEELNLSGDFKSINAFQDIKTPYLTKFAFSNTNICGNLATEISRFLSQCTNLQVLDMSHNNLSTSNAVIIFKGIKNILNLKAIDISYNTITDEAAESIATVLSNNNQLKSLNLSSNHLRSEGFVKICDGMKNTVYLKKLGIGCNEISVTAVSHIATLLFHNVELEELDLSNNFMQTAGIVTVFRSLKNISSLRKVYLQGNIITREAANDIAVILSQNIKLEELDISCSNLQVAGATKILEYMRHISTLTKLNIAHNMISDEMPEYIVDILSSNSKLQELNLSHSYLKDLATLKGLKMTSLTKFYFSSSNIDKQSANALSLFLSHCTNLQVLDLSSINLQGGCIEIVNGLDICNLTECNFRDNGITTDLADKIAAFLSHNHKLEKLDLSYNDLKESGIQEILLSINVYNLRKLNISNNQITGDLKHIADILTLATNILEFDLSYNKLSSDIIEFFLHKTINLFVNLTILNLSGNDICAGAATALANVLSENAKLKELCLNDTNLHTEEIHEIFSKLGFPNLIKLFVNHNNITDEAADDIAVFLSKCNKLEELDLSHNNLKSSGAMKICRTNLTKLTIFKINNNRITVKAADTMGNFISRNTKLQVLDLSHNDLQESGCRNIFSALKDMSLLSVLVICDSSIISKAVDDLVAVLLHNSLLQELDLSYNNLSASDTVKVFKAMKNVSSLETINISHNMITDEAAENIATVLFHNNKLMSLDLSSNYFRCEGFVKIFKSLRDIMYLRKLNVSCNEINAIAANSIARILSHNLKLEELDLGNNFMKTAGTAIIFKGLSQISSIKKLYINGNMITDEAADDIAVILSQNTKLEELDISCNDLQTAGIIKIFKGIENICTLAKFNIAHNEITDEATKYFVDSLSNKNKLKELNLSHTNLKSGIVFQFVDVSNLNKFIFNFNDITEEIANEISTFLLDCAKLQILDLSYTNLHTAGGISVLKAIVFTLKDFSICGNLIPAHTAENIATFISGSDELEELDLSCNILQESGINMILKAINISNLTKLNIANNNITATLESIAGTLSDATKLVELDLSYNKFSANPMDSFSYTSNAMFVNLMKFNISGNKISNGAAAIALAKSLADNTKLKELDLSDNNLNNEGVKKILNRLKTSNLVKLNISHNNISDEAAGDIADFLSKNPKLEELDLSYNNLLTVIAIYRTNLSNLINFNISHNNITIAAADDIAPFLSCNRKLLAFDLSYNDLHELGCRKIFKVLQNIPVLSVLKVSSSNVINEVTDELAAILLQNTLLQELDLSYNNLSTSDTIKIFKAMKNVSNLEAINISHNMITDEAAENIATVLSHNNKLQSIDLSCNYFRGEGFVTIFQGLRNVNYLRKLSIACNEIVVTAAHSIATFLSHNSSLEELDISNSFMQMVGVIIIFKSLSRISSVKKLYIQGNMITDEAADDIATVISQNTKLEELDISCNDLQTAGIIKIFQSIKHIFSLTKLNIAHNMFTDEATEHIVNGLTNKKKLKELNLSHTDMKNMIVFQVVEMSNLTDFTFSYNDITREMADEISDFLSDCTNLQVLDLSYTSLQAAKGIDVLNAIIVTLKKFDICGNLLSLQAADSIAVFLSNNDELEELDLSCNNLQESGISSILKSIYICNLVKLNIANNNITTDLENIAEILSSATKLVELDLSYNKFNANPMDSFSHTPNTIFVNLIKFNISGSKLRSGTPAAALANGLAGNAKLKELNLSDNDLDAEGISKILDALKTSNLIKLDISHNNISDEAADDMAIFLSKNLQLEELDVSHNDLLSTGITKICKVNLSRLVTFDISHNEVTDEAAKSISMVLSCNNKLQSLDLSFNYFKNEGFMKIFYSLKNIMCLRKLNISSNDITAKAASSIATFLSHNAKLEELDLSNNFMQTTGAITIFNSMRNMSSLKKLYFHNNVIGDEAAESIAIILEQNIKLQKLDISFNNLHSVGAIKIFLSLKDILNLTALNVSHNMINDEALEYIVDILFVSSKLRELNLSYNDLADVGALKEYQKIMNLIL